MKCDELQYEHLGKMMSYFPCSTLVIRKQYVDAAIEELKARINELESMPHTDNSAVIDLLSSELEKLRPMEAALEIAEADNKKYIERIKELEADNEKLKDTQRWRKFSDEKPKWGEEVHVLDKEGDPHIVRFSHDMKWISWGKMNTCESDCIVYWMPLPSAPKEAK